jgi:hypothetical protein
MATKIFFFYAGRCIFFFKLKVTVKMLNIKRRM